MATPSNPPSGIQRFQQIGHLPFRHHSAVAGLVFFTLLIASLAPAAFAQIYEPEGINMPGAWNGWTNSNDPATMGDFRMAKRAFGGGQYVATIEIGATGDTTAGNYEMLFTSGPNDTTYANKWAGAKLATDAVSSLTYNTGANNSITLTDGHYTLIFKDAGYQSSQAAVLKTSAAPVTISSVSGLPTGDATPDASTTITVTLSAAPSAEEKIYIRYTTDDWATSQAVQVTGFAGGSTGTADIPGQPSNTTVRFYVLSTTVEPAGWGSDVDLLTLSFDTNSGANYSYSTPLDVTPVTTQDGLWTAPATWAAGAVPAAEDSVVVAHNLTLPTDLTHSNRIRIAAGASLTVSSGATLTAPSLLAQGGLTVSTGATLAASAGVTLDGGTLTVDGTMFNSGGVTGAGAFTVNGTFQLQSGGYTNLPPGYGPASTLVYNTGGSYGRYNEWSAAIGIGYPQNVTLSGSTTLQLGNGAADVERSLAGTLTIEAGSALTLNAPAMTQPLFVLGDVVNQGELTLSDSLGGDLKIAGSFTQNGTFTPNQRALFLQGDAAQTLSASAPLSLPYLIIDNSSPTESVSLASATTVTGKLTLSDGDLQTGGLLTLASGALLIGAEGTTVTGDATFQREITGSAGWRLLSFPLAGATAADLSDDTAVQGVSGGANPGFAPNVLTYAAAGQFAAPGSMSETISTGFALYFFNNTDAGSTPLPITLDVTGTPVFTEQTADLNTVQTFNGSYFTLLGNPYAASYDLGQLAPASGDGFQDNVSFWNGSTYTTADRTLNPRIAPWQGFWLEAAQASSPAGQTAQVRFPTSGLSGEPPSTSYFGKSAASDRRGDLFFTLVSDSTRDEAIRLSLREYATPGFDRADATKQTPLLSRYATLSFVGADGRRKSVESRPFELPEPLDLPLKREFVDVNGQFTLSWDGMDSMPEGWSIRLIDHQTEAVVDLRENASYAFQSEPTRTLQDSSAAAGDSTRFTLRLSPESSSVSTRPEAHSAPGLFELHPNYPNPFNPATTLRFTLDRPAPVELAIYSVMGRKVATLVRESRPAGSHSVAWDASTMASGIYYARLTSQGRTRSIRMTLLK